MVKIKRTRAFEYKWFRDGRKDLTQAEFTELEKGINDSIEKFGFSGKVNEVILTSVDGIMPYTSLLPRK